MYFNVLNIVCYRKQAALFSIFDSLLKLLLVYISLQYFGGEVVGALVPVSAGAFAVFSFVRRYIRSRFLSNFVPRVRVNFLVKGSLLASAPLYFPTLLGALKSVGDRWILAGYIGVDELAAFTILLQLGYFPMTLLVGIIQTFVAPKVYMLSAAQDAGARSDLREFLGKLLVALSIFTLVACGVAYVFADEVFMAFVGPKYKTYASFLPVFVASGAFAAGAGIIQLGAIGLFKTSVVGKLMGATVAISIFCAFSLISAFGFKGASAGLLTSSAISALLYGVVTYFGALRPLQSGA